MASSSLFVEFYQNIANLFVCTCTTLCLLHYGVTKTTDSFYWCLPLNLVHFAVDIWVASSWDIKIHHICGIIIILFHYIYSFKQPDDDYIIYAFYKTELSTFFYVFHFFLTKSYSSCDSSTKTKHTKWKQILAHVNQILFIMTFFRFRIVDYYHEVVANPSMYTQFNPYFLQDRYHFGRLIFFSGLLGMYALNLYWFVLILKKITKSVLRWVRGKLGVTVATGERLTHWWTGGLILGNLFVAAGVYAHAPVPRWFYGLDLAGLLFLVHTCYEYHQTAYEMLLLKEEEESPVLNYYDPHLFWLFWRDKVAIHLRSFLCVATGWIAHTGGTWILTVSVLTHALTLGGTIFYLSATGLHDDDNDDNDDVSHQKHVQRFVRITDISTSVAVGIDTCCILWRAAMMAPSFLHAVEGMWFHVLFAWLLFLVPFYEYNHIVFHLGLWVQTYLLARCNVAGYDV
jgi:TLC domain